MSIKKSDVQFEANGKSVNAYLASPSNGGPGILLLHAWWGLKPFFKQVCDRLAGQGFTVLAPDLFDGKIAQTIEQAKELAGNSDDQVVGDIVMAAKDYLQGITKHKIATLGFSFGAAWAIVTATKEPNVSAMVLFYGAYSLDFSKVKSKVLGHYSDNDEWEPLDGVRSMEQDMKNAGLDVTLHIYPGVHHWFMEEDRPEYDPAAANLAWERTFKFLKQNL